MEKSDKRYLDIVIDANDLDKAVFVLNYIGRRIAKQQLAGTKFLTADVSSKDAYQNWAHVQRLFSEQQATLDGGWVAALDGWVATYLPPASQSQGEARRKLLSSLRVYKQRQSRPAGHDALTVHFENMKGALETLITQSVLKDVKDDLVNSKQFESFARMVVRKALEVVLEGGSISDEVLVRAHNAIYLKTKAD